MTRGHLRAESTFRSPLLSFMVGVCLLYASSGLAGPPPSGAKNRDAAAIRAYVLPLDFEANQGQADEPVKDLARGPGYTVFLTSGAAMVLAPRNARLDAAPHSLRLELQDAANAPATQREAQLPGRSNYFVGSDPGRWRTNIPTFARVRYQQVYPGVDLVYYGQQGQLENDFEVAAGTNPQMISWRLQGADRIRVDSNGNLVLAVGGSELLLQRPRAYQFDGEEQREVPIRYRVHGQNVSFALGRYNRHLKLIIDPVLTYSTYLGGNGGDTAYSVQVDSAGEAYVTGVTASANFPITSAAYQSTYAGDGDVFVTKFNAAGTGIIFSTYLGGSGVDTPSRILLDPAGDIFLVGTTTSNNFPTTSGVFQTVYGGNQDAFLTEMKPDGSALIYSTYIGGTMAEFGTAVTLDSAGDAWVTGATQSTDFPTQNALQLVNDGLYDAFVTEVSPTGALIYSTYLGGSNSDYGTGIAVDSAGDVCVSGYTYSNNFPTQSALQGTLAGGSDIFVSKFTPGSSALLFSTYLGGSSNDMALGMVVDSTGNIYLTGSTQSPNFPVTTTAYQSTLLGTTNAFLTKMAPDASTLVFSTLFGGNQTDQANALALDNSGNIYITGYTQSANFPSLDPFQSVLGISGAGNCGSNNLVNVATTLCADAFVTKFAPAGVPVYSSFLGGNGTDSGQGIAVDSSGAAYVVGGTLSSNFPATAGAFEWLFQGSTVNSMGFVTKVSSSDAPSIALSPQQINFGNQPLQTASTAVTVTLSNPGSSALNITSIAGSGDFHQTNTCGSYVSGGSGTCTIQITFTPTSVGLQTNQITINDSAPGSPHIITVTGNGVLTGGALLVTPSKMTFAAQNVNTTSPSQPALLTNNGTESVTLTNITASPNFGQTNNCGPNFPTVPASLNVGQSCTISVNFTPTTTGNITGSVQIASNASNTPFINLSGTGSPVFTLSANQRSSLVVIGAKSVTFSISVAGPSTFLDNVGLSCSGSATCTFSPTSVPVGGASTLTVSGLTPTTANPYNFTVTGSAGGQSATIALSVFFQDFSLSATPSGTTVTAGNRATYTITVTSINGFDQGVLLSCSTPPVGTICYWNPPAVTLGEQEQRPPAL